MTDKSKLTLKIEQDEDVSSPRVDMDNVGIMVCSHSRYDLGDKDHGYKASQFDSWDHLAEVLARQEDAIHMLPLYLLDHSGLSLSTGSFHDAWDSGQVGIIYTTEARLAKHGVDKSEAEAALKAEVELYDQYLRGDVWGYSVVDADGEVVDSCCGFYGRDDCETEGKAALACAEKEYADKRPMTDPEWTEYVRKLVQDCYDDHKFLVEVVEGFAQDHTYEEYLAECGEAGAEE